MAKQVPNLPPEIMVALKSVISLPENVAKDIRNEVFPGEYEVDCNLRLRGRMTVGEDYEKTPTCRVPTITTIALFMHYAGITRTAAAAALTRALTEAIVDGEKGADVLAAIETVERMVETVQNDILANLPKIPAKGAVTGKLRIDAIELVPDPVA